MSIGDCQACRDLIEAVSLSIIRHFDAVSELALAVRKGSFGSPVSVELRTKVGGHLIGRFCRGGNLPNAVSLEDREPENGA